MVDTGAQSSIISQAVAANLNLPLQPDFTVDICGIGGLQQNVPGYYIDYVKINALGGALEFSNAPFIVLDLQGPDGTVMDGVLGMNFFWNRNIIFQPSLSGSSFLHVSDPVPFGDTDFDDDGDTDLADFEILAATWLGQYGDTNWNGRCDLFIDNSVDITDFLAFLDKWLTANDI